MLRDLTYKVIVIDDDPDLYEDYIEEIQEILKEQGYLLKYTKYEVSNLVENVAITDSNKNFRVLLKVYEVLNGKDDTYNIIKNFIELLSDRNIFAHVREEKSEDGQYQFKRLNNGEYLVLSDEKCIELRTSIINYYKAISNIQ